MTHKVKVIHVEEIKNTSFKTKDGKEITGKIVTCGCEDDSGKTFTVPITAYGKLADLIAVGTELNLSAYKDKAGNKVYNAKKADNSHLVPASSYAGGYSGGKSGGGMSKSDLIFLAACGICEDISDHESFLVAVKNANYLFDEYKNSPAKSVPEAAVAGGDDDLPF